MAQTFLKRGACVVAAAALAAAMAPAAALADETQTTTGGSAEATSGEVEVAYYVGCEWTATYPTSVAMMAEEDGSASADIEFNVTGVIDSRHQVTVTPTSATITLKGERHGETLSAAIAGGTAAAADVNSDDGATVAGSASATAEALGALPVDTYKGTTKFKIQCAPSPSELAITTAPTKTEYVVGQAFDKSGAAFTVTYSDGTKAAKSADEVTFSPSGGLATTDTQVTFTYTEGSKSVTATQAITVSDVTYTLTGASAPAGTVLKASDMLASSTQDYTYSSKTYTAYNGYIGATKYASWYDAQNFVSSLNSNSVGGRTDWRLLESEADSRAWYAATPGASSGFSGVLYLQTSAQYDDSYGRLWRCDSPWWAYDVKTGSYANRGFVVVRGADA